MEMLKTLLAMTGIDPEQLLMQAQAIGEGFVRLEQKIDVITANPPYIARQALALLPREVACHDPWRALDGGADGLRSHHAVAEAATRLLSPHGILATEIGAGQADAVATIIKDHGLVVDGVEKDLAGIARCVIARPAPLGRRGQKKVGMRFGPV